MTVKHFVAQSLDMNQILLKRCKHQIIIILINVSEVWGGVKVWCIDFGLVHRYVRNTLIYLRDWIHLVIFHYLYKGDNFFNFLFALRHTKPLLKYLG